MHVGPQDRDEWKRIEEPGPSGSAGQYPQGQSEEQDRDQLGPLRQVLGRDYVGPDRQQSRQPRRGPFGFGCKVNEPE